MSTSFFNKLNYTLANEDSAIELAMLQPGDSHRVAVAGSGARALPLLDGGPGRLTLVDIVPEQLMLTELRIESLRSLSHAEFLAFWGYPGAAVATPPRLKVVADLNLSAPTREFFTELFTANEGRSILYFGRWERTMKKLARGIKGIMGADYDLLFKATDLLTQQQLLLNEFSQGRWQVAVALLGNSAFFNGLLYKGHFPKINVAPSHYRFYSMVMTRLLHGSLARSNFFLQLLFLGELRYAEGLPVECRAEVYARLQEGLKQCTVDYVQGGILDYLQKAKPESLSFISLSDVPSYLSEAEASSFPQSFLPALQRGARAVLRSYLYRPPSMDFSGYQIETADWTEVIKHELTQVYIFDVLKKE